MVVINGTDEPVEARITMTVMLQPGEGLRDALERAVMKAYGLEPHMPVEDSVYFLIQRIVDEVGVLFSFEPAERPC